MRGHGSHCMTTYGKDTYEPMFEPGANSQVVIMNNKRPPQCIAHLFMGQALPGLILTTIVGSILSSQFNRDGKLSSKTLPAVTQQVKGKAKIWTQNNPIILLSLVGKNVCSTYGKTLPVWVPFPSAYGYGGRN